MSNRVELRAGGLQIAFTRQGDRFAHEIALVNDAEAQPLLRSLEGSDADIWPTSGVYQELHVEERPAGVQVALLVGMAGKSHWSLSCEVDPASQTLSLEAACRVRELPDWLGSSYTLASGVACEAGVLRLPGGSCQFTSSVAVVETPESLRFVPEVREETLPRTVVWSYRLTRLD